MTKGTIKRYDFRKGFGFIADDENGEDFFFHKSEWQGEGAIRRGVEVSFVKKTSDKGPHAESVVPLNDEVSKPTTKKKAPTAPAKPASLESRIASLESTVSTMKLVSLIALVGTIILAADRLF